MLLKEGDVDHLGEEELEFAAESWRGTHRSASPERGNRKRGYRVADYV